MRSAVREWASAVFVLAGGAIAVGCSSSPTQPTVIDPGAPTLTCPAPPSPVQAADGSGAIVTFGVPIVSGGATPLTGPTCNPSSGSRFAPGTTEVTCTVTDAKSRSAPCTFPVVVLQPPKISATRFFAFGDSITWGEDGTNFSLSPEATGQLRPTVQLPTADTYPGALEASLRSRYGTQPVSVTNGGLRNEFAADASTFSRFVSYSSSGRYEVALIMEGANDLQARDDKVYPAVIANLRRMLQDAKSRGIKPFLATLTPERAGGFRALAWDQVPTFNVLLRQLAAQEGVPLVDVYDAFGGDVTTLIGFDGLHPTAAGYHKVADAFFTAIQKALEIPATTTASLRFVPSVFAPRRR